MVEKTLEIDPNDTRALVLKGDILYCLNRDIEALQTFNQVLKLDELCVEAYISKASVLDVLGKDRDSLECCNRALELMGEKFSYLYSTVLEQKLILLIRLKKYREARLILDEAGQRLNRDDYQYLAASFLPELERQVKGRKELRERATELALKVITGNAQPAPEPEPARRKKKRQ